MTLFLKRHKMSVIYFNFFSSVGKLCFIILALNLRTYKLIYLFYTTMQRTNHSDVRCNVLELSGNNYKIWKE